MPLGFYVENIATGETLQAGGGSGEEEAGGEKVQRDKKKSHWKSHSWKMHPSQYLFSEERPHKWGPSSANIFIISSTF